MDDAAGHKLSREELDRLVVAAKSDPDGPLGQLLHFCEQALRQFARQHLPQKLRQFGDSEDVVQDTFERALQHFPDFRGRTMAEFEDWILQTERTVLDARNRYHSAARRDHRREVRSRAGAPGEPPWNRPDPALPPPDATAAIEEAERLRAVVARLPPELAQLIRWYGEGMGRLEIARRLGIPPGAVGHLRDKALLLLRLQLEGPENAGRARPNERNSLSPIIHRRGHHLTSVQACAMRH